MNIFWNKYKFKRDVFFKFQKCGDNKILFKSLKK